MTLLNLSFMVGIGIYLFRYIKEEEPTEEKE